MEFCLAVGNYDNTYVYFGTADIILTDASGIETDRKAVAGGIANTPNSIIATTDGGYAFCGHFGMDDYVSGDWDARYYVQKSGPTGDIPACVVNCVWPGDADNNGAANTDDILAIGLGFGNTGASRADISIDWYAHAADEWATTLPDLTNHKYTDCNGDGTINDDDTLAVSINYSLEHSITTLKTTEGEIPLYVEIPDEGLMIGYNELPIILGDGTNPVEAIYGIRFTVAVDGDGIDASLFNVRFYESWM